MSEQQGERPTAQGWLEPPPGPTTGQAPQYPHAGGEPNGLYPAPGGAYPGLHSHALDPNSGPYGVAPSGPINYAPAGMQQGPPQQGPQQQPPPRYSYSQQAPVSSHAAGRSPQRSFSVGDLSSTALLRQSKGAPRSGWRKAVYLASGRTVNLGESEADIQRGELIGRINQPLHGCYKIVMLSLKGGVGKTTTTVTLGSTFASLRGDRVVAVDANPDRGTLSQKIPLETAATVRHLLRDSYRITRYSDVRAYTSQGPSRLEVLASDSDPAVSEAFSEEDYRRTVDLLEHFYNIVLTDCGTGLLHSAMKGVLDLADCLVLVSSGSIDGARSASATLDWLDMHGYQDLVKRSVAVINAVRPGSGKVDIGKLAEHFDARCRAVHILPFDPHLEEGAEVDLERLKATTRSAMLDLAATIADDFSASASRR